MNEPMLAPFPLDYRELRRGDIERIDVRRQPAECLLRAVWSAEKYQLQGLKAARDCAVHTESVC